MNDCCVDFNFQFEMNLLDKFKTNKTIKTIKRTNGRPKLDLWKEMKEGENAKKLGRSHCKHCSISDTTGVVEHKGRTRELKKHLSNCPNYQRFINYYLMMYLSLLADI